tara:strand:- start:69 stop:263 length:195 start_codon:yes stop_codon:yes gene_type:complete
MMGGLGIQVEARVKKNSNSQKQKQQQPNQNQINSLLFPPSLLLKSHLTPQASRPTPGILLMKVV